jgi:hypothetical protein
LPPTASTTACSFNTLLEMPNGAWHKVYHYVVKSPAFNTLLEMHTVCGLSLQYAIYVSLSILYWRCPLLGAGIMAAPRLRLSILYWRCSTTGGPGRCSACEKLSILYWRCPRVSRRGAAHICTPFQYSIGDARVQPAVAVRNIRDAFNTLLEMLGVLVLGFCGFLSFCVGVCGFLGFVFVLVRRGRVCMYRRVFPPRRRPAVLCCTTFYKLDLRFTKPTRRRSRTTRQR